MTAQKEPKTETAPGIHAAMLAIMGEIGAIEKTRTVSGFGAGYKFRGIDQVYEAIHPLMIKHGVFMTAEVLDKSREERTGTNSSGRPTVTAFTSLRMRYHFRAADGSSVYTEAEGEGMDSGDKSSNKAMAIAHKYAILQAFCVPTEQTDDPDAEVQQIAPREAPPANPPAPEVDAMTAETLRQAFEAAPNLDVLNDMVKRNAAKIRALESKFPADHKTMMAAASKRKAELTTKEGTAA